MAQSLSFTEGGNITPEDEGVKIRTGTCGALGKLQHILA
jgi:hypothetical protein